MESTGKGTVQTEKDPRISDVTIVNPYISFPKACGIEQSQPKQWLGEPCRVGAGAVGWGPTLHYSRVSGSSDYRLTNPYLKYVGRGVSQCPSYSDLGLST